MKYKIEIINESYELQISKNSNSHMEIRIAKWNSNYDFLV